MAGNSVSRGFEIKARSSLLKARPGKREGLLVPGTRVGRRVLHGLV